MKKKYFIVALGFISISIANFMFGNKTPEESLISRYKILKQWDFLLLKLFAKEQMIKNVQSTMTEWL